MKKKRILVYSPYQAITEHAYPERKVAEILGGEGHQITYLGCDGLFAAHCTSMMAFGFKYDSESELRRKLLCFGCKAQRRTIQAQFPVRLVDDFLSAEHRARAEEELRAIDWRAFEDREFEGLKLARMAMYELILEKKLASVEAVRSAPPEHLSVAYRNALYSYFGFKSFLARHPQDLVLVYNGNYGTHHVAREYAARLGIPTVFLHGGSNYEKLHESFFVSHKKPEALLRARVGFFEENAPSLRQDESRMSDVLSHIRHVLSAKTFWVYSSKGTFAGGNVAKLGFDPAKPTALLSTSCLDEVFATDFAVFDSKYVSSARNLFRDQFEWLEQCIRHFWGRPDLQLIVRIHPREFPNRREGVQSARVARYREVLRDLPPNVRANFPEDGISIYDLFAEANLHLVSYSTVGLESAWFGLPTLSTSSGIALYPTRYVNEVPESVEAYFEAIDRILRGEDRRPDFSLVERAYRWMLFDFEQAVVRFDVGDIWKLPRLTLLTRLKRRARQTLGLAQKSYREFSRRFMMEDRERQALLRVFDRGEEVFEAKHSSLPEMPSRFPEFLAGMREVIPYDRIQPLPRRKDGESTR